MMEQRTQRIRIAVDLALAFALSLLLSLVVVALTEAARVPVEEGQGRLARFASAFFPALDGALAILWKLVVLQSLAAALLAIRSVFPASRRWFLALAIAALFGAVLLCHATLVEYPRFAWYPPFIAFHAGIAALLALSSAVFPLPGRSGAPPGRSARLGRRAVPVALIGLFLVLHVLNYELYPDRYTTLHTSALMTSFLLLQAGTMPLLFPLVRKAAGRRVALAGLATLVGVVGSSIPLSGLTSLQADRPGFLRFTVIGQELLRSAGDADEAAGARGAGAHDPEGVERFARQSNLPPLPEDFALLDHNLLLISVETFRADETSMNNPERDLTPDLRAYAEDGAHWFTRAYVGSAYTLQSMTSIFSMAYPSATGLRLFNPRWNGTLSEAYPTAIDHLEDAGYDTFWVSYAGGGSEDGILSWCWPRFNHVTVQSGNEAVYRAAARELTKRKRDDGRFFGWVFFPGPHSPYVAHFDDMPAKTERDRYRQELRYVDGMIRKLLDHLEQTGLDRNTIVIIHGDHGEEFNEHGKHGHEALYRECSNVPLIVNIPGVTGGRSDAPTSLAYLFPWLFSRGNEDLRAAAGSRMEGVFGPVLEATDGAVVSEIFGTFGTRSLLVSGDHHFHHDFASKHNELYDLRGDPGEKKNVFAPEDGLSQAFLERFARYVEVRNRNLNIRFTEGTLDQIETPESIEARAKAMEALREADEDALAAALDDKDWRIRRETLSQLGRRKELREETIDRLVDLLVVDHREVRNGAVRALSRSAASGVNKRLLAALRSDRGRRALFHTYGDGKVRTMAEVVEGVLDKRGAAALPALIEGLGSDDVGILRYASRAVGRFPGAAGEAVPVLETLAGHPDRLVRQNAQASLARLAGK
jgi:arylsulfatase A-like enzyme